jgi:drug/metabolite transporter (DMT)-like permease
MALLSVWCGVTCALVALLRGEELVPATARGWLIVALLALASQVFGQTLMAHSVKYLPLQLASVFVLLQPVIAAVYALLLFGERLSLVQVGGIGVLLVSIYWAKILLEGKNAPADS